MFLVILMGCHLVWRVIDFTASKAKKSSIFAANNSLCRECYCMLQEMRIVSATWHLQHVLLLAANTTVLLYFAFMAAQCWMLHKRLRPHQRTKERPDHTLPHTKDLYVVLIVLLQARLYFLAGLKLPGEYRKKFCQRNNIFTAIQLSKFAHFYN